MHPRPLARLGMPALALALSLCSVAAFAQEKAEATRQYNAAVGLHNTEAYDLAAEEWVKFLNDYKGDPRTDRAWHYLGVCYSKLNKLDEAVKTFETVIKSFPNLDLLPDTYLNLGLTQYNLAQSGKPEMFDAAAATFAALATKYPQGKYTADATFYEAECLYNRGKKQEAAPKYEQVVQKYPENPLAVRALFALGVTQADLGDHKAAMTTYDAFLKKYAADPLAVETTMWRGESQFALQQYAEAAKSYAAAAAGAGFAMADYATVRQADALAAMQQYAEAAALYASVPAKFANSKYIGLCNLEAGKKYYAAGDFAKAQESLAKVAAAPGSSAPEAAHWLARSLLKQSKPADALAAVEKILPSAGEGPFAAQLLTDQADAIYELADRRGEAIALYAAVAAKYPSDPAAPQALYMAAFGAMNQGDYAAALTHADAFLKAQANHPLTVGVLHVKAESSLLSNQFAEAEKLYGELLQKFPDDRDAEIWKVHRGTALYLQKKYQETIDTLTPAMPEIRTADLIAEAWYRIGRSQTALKQYDAAVKSLEASLAAAPKWKLADDTRLVLAYGYQQTGNLDKAKENAQRVIADFPESKLLDMAHYRLAECCRLGGDLKTATAEYQSILKTWPETALLRQTLYGLGWAQVGQEDFAGAETTFSALIEKSPGDALIPRAQYGRGMARRQLGKFDPAVQDIQAFLAASPAAAEKSQAMHVLGLCQKGLQKFDDAVATFNKLLADDPGYADGDSIYFETGWALKSLKKEPEAAAAFAKLLEKYPDSSLAADSQYLIGDFAYDQKDYRKAALAYHPAMTKAGKTKLGEEAAHKLGLTYYMLDDLKNAQQTFLYQRLTWPEGPLVSDAAYMEAECMFKQNDFQNALATYDLVKNPSNEAVKALALLHAGIAAGELGQWDKSLKLMSECVEKYPESPQLPDALYGQGRAQHNLGKLDEALAIYAQAIAKSTPGVSQEAAARAQFMIGEIEFQQKKHAEAVKSFFKVSYGYGYPKWQADATYEAGRCFEALGQKAQAVKQYEQLIAKFAESDKVALAKERIAALQK